MDNFCQCFLNYQQKGWLHLKIPSFLFLLHFSFKNFLEKIKVMILYLVYWLIFLYIFLIAIIMKWIWFILQIWNLLSREVFIIQCLYFMQTNFDIKIIWYFSLGKGPHKNLKSYKPSSHKRKDHIFDIW